LAAIIISITLLDNLVLPTLTPLIEARDPIEDAVSSLLLRSNRRPPLEHLAIAYSTNLSPSDRQRRANTGQEGR